MVRWYWLLWPLGWTLLLPLLHLVEKATGCFLHDHDWWYWGDRSVRTCRHCNTREFYWRCRQRWDSKWPLTDYWAARETWPQIPDSFWNQKKKFYAKPKEK